MIKQHNLFTIIMLFAITGCSSVSRLQSWKLPGYQPKNYQHVLVAGTNDSAAPLRDQLIAQFTASLNQKGYAAQPAGMKLTAADLDGKQQQQTFSLLRNNGTDAVLGIAWANKETEYYYIPTSLKYDYDYRNNIQPGLVYPFPPTPVYSSLKDHYAERTSDIWITSLYDVALGKPVYTIQLKTDRSAATAKVIEKYVQLVMNDMIEKGIIYKTCCPQLAVNR